MTRGEMRGPTLVSVAILLLAALASAPLYGPSSEALTANAVAPVMSPSSSLPSVNFTLHGDAGLGWGFTSATISEPGPPLVVFWKTNVTLTLIADDSADHTWFIDYDNSLARNSGEPGSPIFNPTTGAIVWSFIADRTGNWTYRCGIHPTSMTGSILVIGGPPAPPGGPPIPLISGIMLAALGVVLVFAVIYHVRAVRAAKRMK